MIAFRRYVQGIYPLLVFADDEQAADRTAVVHAFGLAETNPALRGIVERIHEDDGA